VSLVFFFRIEESFIRLKQFTGDLAHELLTPINNLLGETEMGLLRAKTLEDSREIFASNLEELQRISQIIENILFIAKADHPNVQLHQSNIDE
jgi:two-component system heavy metal sensor histidine kinase CusS